MSAFFLSFSTSQKINIFNLPTTEKEAVQFLQLKGILPDHRECTKIHEMKLYFGERIFWKCNKNDCRQTVGLRVGNWLEDTRLSIVTIVRFMYCWAFELTSIKWCERELEMNHETTVDWNMYYRENCVNTLLSLPQHKIGGVF